MADDARDDAGGDRSDAGDDRPDEAAGVSARSPAAPRRDRPAAAGAPDARPRRDDASRAARGNGDGADPQAGLSLGPLPGYLGYKLRQAQTASFRHLDRMAGASDLSPGRFSLLTVIEANPGITQTRIARAFRLDKSTLSPVVDQLVKRRLVARKRSKADGRAYGLSLTAAGVRRLEAKRAQIEAQERLMASTLTPVEQVQMMALLDRLVAALDSAD